ncbi:MAG: LPXTG cell wall anchor domain-containing protein, partial [Oscillospiraceae bacterium]|nr:LPXTG cell wall anchor domain-containing protein [Oscillospiraceae bacterium]
AECGVNPDIYDEVRANSILLNGIPTANSINGTARMDYATSLDTMENRSSVEFDNHVSDNAMRVLSVTKKLYDIDGITELTYPQPETTFTFRLYLGDENADANALPLANMYPYYIKDTEGHYCRWDAGTQTFVSLGDSITTYEALEQFFISNNWTNSQKESVIFKTSMNGSISKIPAGYTVEVRNLVISTQYKIEERDWEIPKGYTRREADGYARVDTGHETTQRTPYTGTIAKNEDPEIQVRNQKGWGLTVEKVWTDKDFMASHDDIYFAVYVGDSFAKIPDHTEEVVDETTYNTVYKDCVRVLKSPKTELYFFFGDLYNGDSTTHQFDDYTIKEVQLTKKTEASAEVTVQLDAEDYVTNLSDFDVKPIEESGTLTKLTVGGTPVGGSHQDGIAYTVSYQVGESTGQNENIRTDTVTNSRPGIKLYKTNWSGAWNEGVLTGALSGAKFTLKDSAGNDVAAASYTSGSDGLITIAYLNEGNYTLTEIETPNGYVRLDSPITITVAANGTVSVSGVDSSYYILDTTTDTSMAAILTIKNRETELQVKKVDEKTNNPLAGVHFALYRQVTDSSGNARKDYLPMTGYEDLVTDENGILPHITMALGAGTYYLTETQTQSGYSLLSEDICFTIGIDGTVTVNNGANTGSTVTRTDDTENGKTTYVLTIPNYKLGVKLKKVDDHNNSLAGAKFSLCIKNGTSAWEDVNGYSEIDMTSTSVTTLSDLADGLYKLTETVSPAGYIILEKAVFFKIENGTVELTKEDGTTPAESGKAVLTTETDQDKNMIYVITVKNTPGMVLPETGGRGTGAHSAFGLALVLAAAMLLQGKKRKNGKS